MREQITAPSASEAVHGATTPGLMSKCILCLFWESRYSLLDGPTMPPQRSKTNEQVLGYRLIELLGAGGFGEVWKAEAPGGLLKAIKFVYGKLTDRQASQELTLRADQAGTSPVRAVARAGRSVRGPAHHGE